MSHPFHPVSELFPLMTGAPFDELVADIKANGLRESIWRHDGQIIDGRNRYLACEQCGVEPTYREWEGTGDLTKFVVSLNLHRRHLSESQRAMIATKIAARPDGQSKFPTANKFNHPTPPPTNAEAAELLNVSRSSVVAAKKVRRDCAPEIVSAVESGEISLHTATQMSAEPKEEQLSALTAKREGIHREPTIRKNNGNGIIPKTRTYAGRKAPAAIRGAIGTLVGLASGLDSFTVKDAAPTDEEAEQWERDLAVVISAINRFRRQLKERANV